MPRNAAARNANSRDLLVIHVNRKEKNMSKLATIFAILAMSLGLSACNTMKGMGQDIERGGEKVQESAQDVQSGND
jgi:entericidin B